MEPGAGPDDGQPPAAAAVGTVRELLPSALVKVELDGGHLVTAHMSGEPSRNFVRLLVGDRVRVAMSPADRTRGRVVGKL
jgi:translation initiation factor IF-1